MFADQAQQQALIGLAQLCRARGFIHHLRFGTQGGSGASRGATTSWDQAAFHGIEMDYKEYLKSW
jgi:hypothetical protein